jgi:hypothetical protein
MKEQCRGCKKIKNGVQLRACDDRLCQDCFLANEAALAKIQHSPAHVEIHVTPQTKAMTAASAASATPTEAPIAASGTRSATACNSQLSSDNRVIINELLSYVRFFRDRGNAAALHHVAVNFYTACEISAAKKCLIDAFQQDVISMPVHY